MARRNNGTIKGGARRVPTAAIDTGRYQDARGKREGDTWSKTASHNRRHRNPKHGPKGSNPFGEASLPAKRRDGVGAD